MRVGFNPHKDEPLEKSNYLHQVIIPVFIPNLETDYYKDALKVLDTCLNSLFKTSHSQTLITIVNNGSCEEVIDYLNKLFSQNKIHEIYHTQNVGIRNGN